VPKARSLAKDLELEPSANKRVKLNSEAPVPEVVDMNDAKELGNLKKGKKGRARE